MIDDPLKQKSPLSRKELRAQERRDIQLLIQETLSSPITRGPVHEVDGEVCVTDLAEKNTTVKTRIILQAAVEAMKGEPKSRDFLFKYAGYEPPSEQDIMVEPVSFIDDISAPKEGGEGESETEPADDDDILPICDIQDGP